MDVAPAKSKRSKTISERGGYEKTGRKPPGRRSAIQKKADARREKMEAEGHMADLR